MAGKSTGLRFLYQGFNQLRIHNSSYSSSSYFNNRLSSQSTLTLPLITPGMNFCSVPQAIVPNGNKQNQSGNNNQSSTSQQTEQKRSSFGKFGAFIIGSGLGASVIQFLINKQEKEENEKRVTLENIENKVNQQWAENHALFNELQGLVSQSKLYLYSDISPEELKKHKDANERLSLQLKKNERCQKELNQIRSSFVYTISLKIKQQYEVIKEDLGEQEQLLKIAYELEKALWCHKQKEFIKAEDFIEKVIVKIEQYQALKRPSMKVEDHLLDINSLFVTTYNLKAKIERCLASMRRDDRGQLNAEWLEASKDSYLKALEHDSENPIILNSLGCLLTDMKRPEEGLRWHQKANRNKPSDPTILEGHGYCLYRIERTKEKNQQKMDKNQLQESLRLIDQGLQLKKTSLLYTRRGVVLRAIKGPDDEVLSAFDNALKLDPVYPRALYQRGLTYQALNRTADSLSDLNAACAAYGNNEKKVRKIRGLIS